MGMSLLVLGIPVAALSNIGSRDFFRGKSLDAGTEITVLNCRSGAVAVMAAHVHRCTVNGEQVVPQPGGFYGGWVTSWVVGPFKESRGPVW